MEKPLNNIAEISLIGTGGGYGESSVIHVGNQNWIIVDSCIDPESGKSLPIEYLKAIGVNVENDVKLIICTHWHDDHILGISKALEECKSAEFSCARVTDKIKFLQFVELDYQKLKKVGTNSSTIEFRRCLEILSDRMEIVEAHKDRVLKNFKFNDRISSECISLSPSDFSEQNFSREIAELITEFGAPNKKVLISTPNAKSVALYLKLGNHRAILGADLEVGNRPNDGWLNIINNNQVIDKKATFFKIPHHGSENGYHEQIWLRLLDESPVSSMTPWNKSRKLPTIEMQKKYSELTEGLYMTSRIFSDKPKKRDQKINKLLSQFNLHLREIRYKYGVIRARVDISDPNSKWEVELFGEAFHINPEINS